MKMQTSNAEKILGLYSVWQENEALYTSLLQKKFKTISPTALEKNFRIAMRYGVPVIEGKINLFFFAGYFQNHLRLQYDLEGKNFFQYYEETGVWKKQNEEVIMSAIVYGIQEIANVWQDERIQKRATVETAKNIMSVMMGMPECAVEKWKQRNGYILVRNGVYDYAKKKLYNFSSKFQLRTRIDVKYNPEAICPEFQQMLDQILPPIDQEMLQMYAGQCILGKNITSTILLVRGVGGTGKSTLLNIISGLIGQENIFPVRIENLGDRFETSFYVGKTLLIGNDVPGNFLQHPNVNFLKSLVGGDTIGVEKKNVKDTFYVEGNYNIIIVSNGRLHVRVDADVEAWRRRLIVLDLFAKPFTHPVHNFHRHLLKKEAEGILNWAIEGLQKLIFATESGLSFPLTETQIERRDNLLCESDSVTYFLKHNIEKMYGCEITLDELKTRYINFCAQKMWHPIWYSQMKTQFAESMMLEFHVPLTEDFKFQNVRFIEEGENNANE